MMEQCPPCHGQGRGQSYSWHTVADQLDVDAMIVRYRGRAEAVRNRSLPPVAGEERRRFIQQAEEDYMDYSLVGAAKWSVEEGHLVLRIPLGGGG